MAATALVDTGALLALLDKDDKWHKACVEVFRSVHFPVLTTIAVLTELLHLTLRDFGTVEPAWQLLETQGVQLAPVLSDELWSLRRLMLEYGDRPMDFADATLVHVANRESISTIVTIDHDDFETYRLKGNKKFNIRPHRNATTR
ncbi:MAG TPA: PIN domain-containing protein [Terriglobales bacterium]|nr:PIN domain-containing protein [Terriglobales bacterium]